MPTVTVTCAGETATATYGSPGYYPPPRLTAYPIVDFASLPGATPTNLAATLAAVSSDRYVRLAPNTDYYLGDFTQGAWAQGGYACYAAHVVGLICDATTDPTKRARIHLPGSAMSAASLAKIPGQSSGQTNNLWALRCGPNQINNLIDNVYFGVEFVGHNQRTDPNTGLPATWNGLQLYYPGANTQVKWCKFTGFGMGTFNCPPGETNMLSTLGGAGMNLFGVEATGFNGDGTRSGGAVSANGTDAIYWENVNVHDTRVSGVTFSTGGGKSCGSLHTKNLRVANNANHAAGSGQDFGGVNNEGVAGPILHESPDIFEPLDFDPAHGGGAFAVNNQQFNATWAVTAAGPFWHGISPSWAFGCLAVQVLTYYPASPTLNKQTNLPTVTVAGVTLTPVERSVATAANTNPARNYVVSRIWG